MTSQGRGSRLREVGARLALGAMFWAAPPFAAADPPPQAVQSGEQVAPAAATPKSDEQKTLEEQIKKELGQGQPPGPASGVPPAAAPSGATGTSPYARLLLIPDISAIGDFASAYDTRDVSRDSPRAERDPRSPPHKLAFQFQELELGFQAVVDPYARADVFVSFEQGSVDVEEAYLTSLTLPGGLQLKAGKFRSPVGRLNQEHPHVWDFIDAPLALSRVVSSAEALLGPGVDVAWLAPLPWYAELSAALQSTSPQFAGSERLTAILHLSQFFGLGEGNTLGVGLTAGRMDEPAPAKWRDLGAIDAYLRIRPVAGRAYVILQGEFFARRIQVPGPDETTAGSYVQAIWRPGPYVDYGLRWEEARAVGGGIEQRLSGLVGWFPSEFQKLRFQVAYDDLPRGRVGLEAIVHLEFVIGAHGAHPF